MVESVLNSILPVCLLMALGAALRHFRFLPEVFFAQMNRLGFWLLLPTLLFSTIVKAPVSAGGNGLKIALLLCACSVAVTGIGWLTSRMMRLPEGSARALMQAAMRGNLAYTALPVLIYTFGENSAAAASAAFALAPTIPFYNFWAVLILTGPKAARAGGAEAGEGAGHLLRALAAILRNPLIIGCALGLVTLRSGLHIPKSIFNAVETLGRAALPCALIALGAGLTPEKMQASLRPALAATALKLVAMPAIGLLLASAFGVGGDLLLITLINLASPCAVTSYVMADQMGADKELAGSAIALSTLLCLPVMALLLLLFRA
ncbi:MAG TPA: AEC family transporter [Kiritimatiellia bacterium]|nr:AEC family transporter [Kiritimatiellia bacterium]HPS06783.1 AEC family transporter [Kiritimatiellia bacterium]